VLACSHASWSHGVRRLALPSDTLQLLDMVFQHAILSAKRHHERMTFDRVRDCSYNSNSDEYTFHQRADVDSFRTSQHILRMRGRSISNHESKSQPKMVSESRPETPKRPVQACDGSSVIGAGTIPGARGLQILPLGPTSFQMLRNVVVPTCSRGMWIFWCESDG